MEFERGRAAETELFDWRALLESAGGDGEKASSALKAAMDEAYEVLGGMRTKAGGGDFQGAAGGLEGANRLARAMSSRMLEQCVRSLAKAFAMRSAKEVRVSLDDLECCLMQLELHVRFKGRR